MVYETNKYAFNFQTFEMIKSFCHGIFSSKITLGKVDKKQSNLSENILEFDSWARPRSKEISRKKILLKI